MLVRRLWIVALVVIGGCGRTVYEVDLRPDGRAMTRTLSLMRVDSDESSSPAAIPDDEELRLRKLYADGKTDRESGRVRFTATFTGKMPADVGGSGSFDFFDTSLGSLSIYAERFRGDDDLATAMADRRAAIDDVVDLLVGWVDASFEESERATLRGFVDTGFRNDFHNLALYVWTASAIAGDFDDDVVEERTWTPMLRMAQYLVERDYLTITDLPAIGRMMSNNDGDALMEFARMAIVRKTNASADAYGLLKSRTKTHASMVEHLKTTPQYEAYLREQQKPDAVEDAEDVDPMGVLVTPLFRLLPGLTGGRETIDVTLHLPHKPFMTNGKWDEDDGEVQWVRDMGSSVMPVFVHATWTQPNVAEQTVRFGRVLITDRDLSTYAMWLHSLSDAETKHWNAMLETLDASEGIDDVIRTLRSFRFADQPDLENPITGVWITKLES